MILPDFDGSLTALRKNYSKSENYVKQQPDLSIFIVQNIQQKNENLNNFHEGKTLQHEFRRRIWMTLIGVTVCGIAVGLFSYADFGLDPFQVFAHGTWNLTPLDFGTWYAVLNAAMLVVIFFVNRRKIGIGTIINLFLIGYVAEFSEWVLRRLAGQEPGIVIRAVFLAAGIVVLCFSSALYFTADLGVSTYDAVAITIDERVPKWKFKYIRIATDLICVLTGFALGASVGVGTLVTAFFMGPLISWFNEKVAIPLRYGRDADAAAIAAGQKMRH